MKKIIISIVLIIVLLVVFYLFSLESGQVIDDINKQNNNQEIINIIKEEIKNDDKRPEDNIKKDGGEDEVVVKDLIENLASYKVDFIARWSSKTHPNSYPVGAHFSPFVVYSHGNLPDAKIFSLGGIATLGVEDMAETGATVKLNNEIDKIIVNNLAYKKTQGQVFNSPGTSISQLELSKNYSYITFVSMLAPSPDWFVSVSDNLIKDGNWVDRLELELTTYDAGSDSGERLTSENKDIIPKETIKIFGNNLQGLGKIILTRINIK
jgi:hypothetical protein